MEYQEIITAYKEDNLDISNLKERLEMAKSLKGRSKFRALNRIEDSIDFIFEIPNTLVIPEKPEKWGQFKRSCDRILKEYYAILIKSLEETDAWGFLKLAHSDYSEESFEELNSEEKFEILLELNEKYSYFLKYQKVADIRDCLDRGTELDDKTIKRLEFLNKMLEASENPRTKTEFYMFNEKFLITLANYSKARNVKLEDYMKSKGKNIKDEYIKLSKFFSPEDLKDIAENLVLTSTTLNISIPNIIQAFSEISETEMEIEYFLSEHKEISQLKAKYQKMELIKEENKKIEQEKLLQEDITKEKVKIQKKVKIEDNQENDNNIKISEEEYTDELKTQIKEEQEIPKAKETVNYIKLFWLQREEKQSARTMSTEQLSSFLDKVKQMETETGIRSSLFLITNSNEEITKKRFKKLQNEAIDRGMPRLLEGALGGYSSFKIELDGSVKNISQMSETNRLKIITLMNSYGIEEAYVNNDEHAYVRYEFSNENDKSITLLSLNRLKTVLENRIKRSNQPIELLTYLEGNYSGIDVVLNSQIMGINQISDYYDSKYNILNKKGFTVYSNKIDEFDFHKNIEKKSQIEER